MDHQQLPRGQDIPPIHIVYAPAFLQQSPKLHAGSEAENESFQRYWDQYSYFFRQQSYGESYLYGKAYWRLPEHLGFDRDRLLRGDFSERGQRETFALLTH